MRVLLIKLSSMGDIIHTLPALTDACKHVPNLKITWVVEPGFAEIAHWHPAVEKVIPIPIRKGKWSEIFTALSQIRAQQYDMVIDVQGLLKSAMLARLVKSKIRAGYDWSSCRESPASLLYNNKYAASWDEHAVRRARQLLAQIFKYEFNPHYVDYGVNWQALTQANTDPKPYVVFLHGTTWDSKHWPDKYWFELANIHAQNGLNVKVTWATAEQKARATALAQQCANVIMLPHLNLNQALSVLHNAVGVVAVDTGFAHLSAALDKPLVGIYGPTDVKHSGTVGNRNVNLASTYACAPCEQRQCKFVDANTLTPPCFQEITPQLVWQHLSRLLANVA